MAVEVTVNGRVEHWSRPRSVADYLAERRIKTGAVVVEFNGRILDRGEYDRVSVSGGDCLEIVYFMGGGTPPSSRRRC